MTKLDVVKRIRELTGINAVVGRAVVEAFCEVVQAAVTRGDTVYVRRFGSFGPKHRPPKVARNMVQNTVVPIEARTIPCFKPSPEFVDQVRLSGAETNRGQ